MRLQNLNFLLFFSVFVSFSAAQILLGSYLSASSLNRTWDSPNTTSSVGFIRVDSSYVAAVYYSGGVPIWTAGGSSMLIDSCGSFNFNSNGTLQLLNGSWYVLWDSNRLVVTEALLDNSGNLILRNGSGATVWSTFQNPTDTIIPTQNFKARQVLKSGLYPFQLLNSGNLTHLE